MKQPKITFLTDRMIKGHGVDLVVDRIAHGLAKKGYIAEVYANLVDETFTNRKSYKIYRLPPIGLGNAFVLEKRVRKFANFLNSRETDLYIIQSFPFYSLIPKLKKPTLVVDHGIISTVGIPLRRRLFYIYQRLSQNISYFRKAERIVTVSEYLLGQLPGSIRKKADFIYNGIDHYKYSRLCADDVKQYRQELGLNEQDVLLLYVGRLNLSNQPYKGLGELIDIYQKISLKNPAIKLLAVGFGSKNDEEFLKNQGLLCHVNVEEEKMPLIYSACDIYTTCSKWEGFDLPVGEAQYFSKPVICYNIGAHPEIMQNGKTGYIVNDADSFAEKAMLLARDKDMRLRMGNYAKSFIDIFNWQNSINKYDQQIRKILNLGPAELKKHEDTETKKIEEKISEEKVRLTLGNIEESLKKKVAVIIINYNSSYQCLKECLVSLKSQTYKNIEIIIYDNNSTNDTLDIVKKEFDDIKIIKSDKNLGLAAAINNSLKFTDSEYVLLSSFDVTYEKIAIEEFVETINGLDSRYVGLAPKIKLYHQPEYIDSVGVSVDSNLYIGYNGIGQLDLNQYDKPEDIFGVSFTSAFLRRDYLQHSAIETGGQPMDPNYFLFYEDIDFCYRANLTGYKFKSCPTSMVYHRYAYSFRDETTAFVTKYYYLKLNVMKLAYKNAETANMKRVIKNERNIQLLNLKDRNLKSVARKILADAAKSLSSLKKQRQYIQMTRQIPDSDIFKFSWGEYNFFDIARNEPVYCIQNLILTYKRLFIITGSRKYEEYINYLQVLDDTRFKIEPNYLRQFLHGKLEYEPKPIHEFIDRIR